MLNKKYLHREAFCLMKYLCKNCNKEEILWNSRDGVTPFIICCRHCGKEMSHINWIEDFCLPEFKPPPGMRIFIDLTPEKHREYTKKRAELYWNDEKFKDLKTREKYNSLEEFINFLCISYNPGEPDIKVIET